MTREELEMRKLVRESDVIDKTDGTELAKAFNHLWEKYIEQEPCEDWYDVPSDEMTLEQARQAVTDLRKKLKEHLEQEPCDVFEELDFIQEHKKTPVTLDLTPCDEYGNYRYPSDIELTEPNTATSMPCDDAISRQAVLDTLDNMDNVLDEDRAIENYKELLKECYEVLPSVNPTKTGHWILKRTFPTKLYDENLNEYKCSECYREIRCTESQLVNYPYCHCGAKMVEPQESEKE